MQTMSREQWIAFANDGTRTGTRSLKGTALRRDPRFALCVDLPEPPYSFVLLECEATLSEDTEAMLPWSIRLGTALAGVAD